jgi:predicted amidohydrolase
MKLAVCQEKSPAGDVPGALDLMHRRVSAAAAQGAGLVIFPEMFLTGYNIGDAVFRLAEAADGPSAAAAAEIARRSRAAILYGYPERSGGRVFNAASLVNAAGERVAGYRKTHLYGSEEKRLFQGGDSLVVAELGGLTVGILICYDVEFPEAVRALALAGAELIAVPTALIEPYAFAARTLVPARAIENQVYIAYAGLCGSEGGLAYCGLSCIVGPGGQGLAQAEADPALLVADIDVSAITEGRIANPYLSDRHPALYASGVLRRRSPSAKDAGRPR